MLACALFAFSACDKEDGERTESRVEVALDANAIELTVGETHTLTARVTPEAEAGASVVWASANPEVAVVDAGVVTAVGAGETTVTASVGESSAACRVTVTESEPEPEPEPSEPKVGDYFYSDGTWSDGGLVSIEADGLNPVWADEKPAPVAGKQVIGIVFLAMSGLDQFVIGLSTLDIVLNVLIHLLGLFGLGYAVLRLYAHGKDTK